MMGVNLIYLASGHKHMTFVESLYVGNKNEPLSMSNVVLVDVFLSLLVGRRQYFFIRRESFSNFWFLQVLPDWGCQHFCERKGVLRTVTFVMFVKYATSFDMTFVENKF